MNRFTAIVLTLLTASGTALSQRGIDMRGEDIKAAGDVQSGSFTLDGTTITEWSGYGVSYTNLTDVPSEFPPEAHQHDYTAITNAPWLTSYIRSIVAAGGDATLGVTTNGNEVTYTVAVDFLDWVLDDDPVYLAALTNMIEGAGIEITGTGRSRTVTSTITQYEDTDAVAAIKADAAWKATQWDEAYGWGDHAGVYLPIDGTADSALRLESEDGLTWIVMAGGTGTLYNVTFSNEVYQLPDTNTIEIVGQDNYNGPSGPWMFHSSGTFIEYHDDPFEYMLYYEEGVETWALEDKESAGVAEWRSASTYTDPLDMPVLLAADYGTAEGTVTIDYETYNTYTNQVPVTNSVAITTAADLAAAIAALNLGTMAQEDATSYDTSAEVSGKITASTNALADVAHTGTAVASGKIESPDGDSWVVVTDGGIVARYRIIGEAPPISTPIPTTDDLIAATNALADVAHTGAYADLTGTPTLPDITAASVTPVAVTNDWLYLSAGAWQSLDSGGATTNSLSIEPGLATSIDFIRLDVRWDGVSTILWPGTNLVTYADTLDISSNQVNTVVFDSKMFETNWTAYQIGGE